MKWYRKAADQGNAYGQADLADMYASGKGVGKDEAEALRIYRLAVAQSDAPGWAKERLAKLEKKVAAENQQQSDSTVERIGEVGGWIIAYDRSGDGACLAVGEYRGGTTFEIGKKGPDGIWLTRVTNPKWASVKAGDQYDIKYVFNGRRSWSGGDTGMENGFMSERVKEAFIEDFARSLTLQIRYRDKKIDQFNLSGTRAATEAVKDCYASQIEKTDPFASSKQKDPFAPLSASSIQSTPSFEQFGVDSIYRGETTFPDFHGRDSSYSMFKTRIREGMRNGPNFAGFFSLIQFGCGTDCSSVYIANNKTGQIFDFPRDGEEHSFLQLRFKRYSSMVIAQWGNYNPNICILEYFEWQKTTFRLLLSKRLGSSDECFTNISTHIKN